MVKTKLSKAAGRFGARYGQRVKRKIANIESKQRKKQICPFCDGKAKRRSKGIWLCKKCKRKFAAHAYYLEKEAISVKKEERKKPEKTKTLKKPKVMKKQQTKLKTKKTAKKK
jgi:large subunit ribosomal protein L37Ae